MTNFRKSRVDNMWNAHSKVFVIYEHFNNSVESPVHKSRTSKRTAGKPMQFPGRIPSLYRGKQPEWCNEESMN